jgi:hypothetical protein
VCAAEEINSSNILYSYCRNVGTESKLNLATRTIKISISSHQWLKQGFKADGDFETAQEIVSQDLVDHHESRNEASTAKKGYIHFFTSFLCILVYFLHSLFFASFLSPL